MTDSEDAENEARNEKMKQCRHVPFALFDGRIKCLLCNGYFALVLLPRKDKPCPIVENTGVKQR